MEDKFPNHCLTISETFLFFRQRTGGQGGFWTSIKTFDNIFDQYLPDLRRSNITTHVCICVS